MKRKPTFEGGTCLNWSRISNYSSEVYSSPSGAMDFGVANHNHCRNPDNRAAPYCYTKFEPDDIQWEYCNIKRCSVGNDRVSALPSALLQREMTNLGLFPTELKFRRKQKIDGDEFGWAKSQKYSRKRKNPAFDWPWRFVSDSKDYFNTECRFPFYLSEKFGELEGWHEKCVDWSYEIRKALPNNDFESEKRKLSVCRIDEMVYEDDEPVLAICHRESGGIWSSWSEPRCPACGKATRSITNRFCRVGECAGQSTRTGAECSGLVPCTTSCLDLNTHGHNYVGNVDRDYKGRECIPWEDTLIGQKHKHAYAGSSNYCRNRHLAVGKLFCIVKVLLDYEVSQCDIPLCVGSVDLVLTEGDNFCHFPFRDTKGMMRESCFRDHGRWMCYGGKKKRGVRVLEQCLHSYRGTWGKWTKIGCTKICGGGVMRERRLCRFPPCVDSAGSESTEEIREDGKDLCNAFSCDDLDQMREFEFKVSAQDGQSERFDRMCQFPFKFKGATYFRCWPSEPPTERGLVRYKGSGQWCGLVPDLDETLFYTRTATNCKEKCESEESFLTDGFCSYCKGYCCNVELKDNTCGQDILELISGEVIEPEEHHCFQEGGTQG